MKTVYIYSIFTVDSNNVFCSKALFLVDFLTRYFNSHLFCFSYFLLLEKSWSPLRLFFQLCLLSLLPSVFGSWRAKTHGEWTNTSSLDPFKSENVSCCYSFLGSHTKNKKIQKKKEIYSEEIKK